MPTLIEVNNQINQLQTKSFWKSELKLLADSLHTGEEVKGISKGFYNGGNSTVVITNKRLLILKKNIFRSLVEEFPYSKINSVQYRDGIMFGSLVVFAAGNEALIKQMDKKAGKPLSNLLSEFVSKN